MQKTEKRYITLVKAVDYSGLSMTAIGIVAVLGGVATASFGGDELFKAGAQMAGYGIGGIFAAPFVQSLAKDLLIHIDEKKNNKSLPSTGESLDNVIEFRRIK